MSDMDLGSYAESANNLPYWAIAARIEAHEFIQRAQKQSGSFTSVPSNPRLTDVDLFKLIKKDFPNISLLALNYCNPIAYNRVVSEVSVFRGKCSLVEPGRLTYQIEYEKSILIDTVKKYPDYIFQFQNVVNCYMRIAEIRIRELESMRKEYFISKKDASETLSPVLYKETTSEMKEQLHRLFNLQQFTLLTQEYHFRNKMDVYGFHHATFSLDEDISYEKLEEDISWRSYTCQKHYGIHSSKLDEIVQKIISAKHTDMWYMSI